MISDAYRELNRQHHAEMDTWGTGAAHHIDTVRQLADHMGTIDILDYGCGKGSLGRALGFPIKEYDPCVPGKDTSPEPADLVVCISVLEHVEPEFVDDVLGDLRRCTKKAAFIKIPQGPSLDYLPDGRNAHINMHPHDWWVNKMRQFFNIHMQTQLQDMKSIEPGKIMLGISSYFVVW